MVAISYGGPLAIEQGESNVPDCHVCDGDEGAPNRARWGCDAPLTEAVWSIHCECGGIKRDCARTDCDDGKRPLYRCPRALMREAPADVLAFFGMWGIYRERGVLPCAGGMLDQPATFTQACAIADSEKAAWDRVRDEHMAEQRRQGGGKVNRGR